MYGIVYFYIRILDNVNEYLKLAASAGDKQQLQRIKTVFEKKNQKSAHTISQLQKKLESYSKRAKDLQTQQLVQNPKSQSHRQPREVLRDVGLGLKYLKKPKIDKNFIDKI